MLRIRTVVSAGFLASVVLSGGVGRADVTLPKIISSHMVLQRGSDVPVWGKAAAGESVTVSFRDQKVTTEADRTGNWKVMLKPLTAGGPDVMTITGKNTVKLENVLVGEVWVGSGQSNMAGNAGGYAKGDPGLAEMIKAAPYPQIRVATAAGGWREGTEQNINSFSAILFAFGRQLHADLKVPIGLMVGAVGGTPSGYWLSQEAYDADEGCKAAARAAEAANPIAKRMEAHKAALAKWEKDAEQAKKDNKPVPKQPAAPVAAGKSSGQIGNLYERHIRPFVPYGIRGVLWDQGESGTAVQGVDQYTLMGALIRGWRKEWGQGDFPFVYVQKPSGGGCAWDPADPVTNKADKFEPLPAAVPGHNDGLYRENHIKIGTHPKTIFVTCTDLGPGVHPTNKSGYGIRAARSAESIVYGQSVVARGPSYKSHEVKGSTVVVTFGDVGKGLAFKHGEKLQGFAVAGADRVFHWADAKIDGDSVVVSHPKVDKPVAVRYAWASRHPWANLFNKDGLPALMFRTDTFDATNPPPKKTTSE